MPSERHQPKRREFIVKGVRDQAYLVTKVETTDPARVSTAVEKSLRELQTDYLDAIKKMKVE